MRWPVKVKKGYLLSPIDLSSYERYLKKFPRDAAIRFEYARYLEQKGDWVEALEHYELASEDGHLQSTIRLKQVHLQHGSDVSTSVKRNRERKRRKRRALLIFSLLLLVLVGSLPLLPTFVGVPDPLEAAMSAPVSRVETTKEEELPLLVMKNAAARYQEAKGYLPATFADLTGAAPEENWLSVIEPDPTRSCPCLVGLPVLKLHYYPATNQLALLRDEEVLALYPVASGPALPFTKTKITKRIVNPNGGQGVYGSRGLVLQDDYAIHGTNKPELIGQRGITKGCLRMRDEDIEVLYSYVSIGTPFEVKEGTPPPPTFANGLPMLGSGIDGGGMTTHPNLKREETRSIVYTWKY